jgi:hypothetical protein
VKMDGTVEDYSGTYEEYLRSQAIAGWYSQNNSPFK